MSSSPCDEDARAVCDAPLHAVAHAPAQKPLPLVAAPAIRQRCQRLVISDPGCCHCAGLGQCLAPDVIALGVLAEHKVKELPVAGCELCQAELLDVALALGGAVLARWGLAVWVADVVDAE